MPSQAKLAQLFSKFFRRADFEQNFLLTWLLFRLLSATFCLIVSKLQRHAPARSGLAIAGAMVEWGRMMSLSQRERTAFVTKEKRLMKRLMKRLLRKRIGGWLPAIAMAVWLLTSVAHGQDNQANMTQEVVPMTGYLPGPLGHPRMEDGGFYLAIQGLYMRQTNPMGNQNIAFRG